MLGDIPDLPFTEPQCSSALAEYTRAQVATGRLDSRLIDVILGTRRHSCSPDEVRLPLPSIRTVFPDCRLFLFFRFWSPVEPFSRSSRYALRSTARRNGDSRISKAMPRGTSLCAVGRRHQFHTASHAPLSGLWEAVRTPIWAEDALTSTRGLHRQNPRHEGGGGGVPLLEVLSEFLQAEFLYPKMRSSRDNSSFSHTEGI